MKVAVDSKDRIRYFSRLPIPYDRDFSSAKLLKCLGLYLYDKAFISSYGSFHEGYLEKTECVEQLRCIENDLNIKAVFVDFDSLSVDTMVDLQYVRSLDASKFVE